MRQILNRLKAPTPKFFRKLRNIALLVGAVARFGNWRNSTCNNGQKKIAVSSTVAGVSQLVTKEEQDQQCISSDK